MGEREYYLGFSTVPGMGPAKFKKLLEEFGTAKAACSAKQTSLEILFGKELSEKLSLFRKKFSIGDYSKELKRKGVWFLTLLDEDYPQILREIKSPPFVLYGKGNIDVLSARQAALWDDVRLQNSEEQALIPVSLSKNRHQTETQPIFNSPASGLPRATIAIVGARKTTEYGREVTRMLTEELVANGFTIVSGLALGVDAVSHMTALEFKGRTIAVLGCGVDCCNPRENQSIYDNILKSGNCIISEFPLGMKPTQWTFPARNRIIAGLSQAVLVTEGAQDSGSLITAEFALKFGRKVFAVPGPITSSMSKGPYKLIAKGAKLVTDAKDILNELKITNSPLRQGSAGQAKLKGATEEELKILKLLENEALHFDEIVRKTKFNSSKLSSTLSLMEIKGMVKTLSDGHFSIAA